MISWSTKRRLSIFLGILLVLIFGLWLVWFFAFRSPASCFDSIKTDNELGIDCGGVCNKVCEEEVVPLVVLWSKPFPLRQGVVNVAALVENQNARFSIPRLSYNFKLYDKDNVLITERGGKTFANANERLLILEPQISVGERVPARAFIEIASPTWERLRITPRRIPITVRQRELSQGDVPQLTASIENNDVRTIYDLTVLALVVDKDENALGVSSTFINSVPTGRTSDITFTWPFAFSKEAVAVSLYPRIDQTRENR